MAGGQPQASVQIPTVPSVCTQKTPGACTQSASSALRSRVQGKNPRQPRAAGRWGWGPGGMCYWQLPATGPHPQAAIFPSPLAGALMMQGRQPAETGQPEALPSTLQESHPHQAVHPRAEEAGRGRSHRECGMGWSSGREGQRWEEVGQDGPVLLF